ncbi:unnamed protein product [Parnassius apollo]|uniref:(apollo) hypothetical protein n=1 Tax=Parnassius apollo TaxID=110799 RepID=A0A8S3Y7L6_PARAO|nr:unnamed protein product [Parnassius apollo]
MYVELVKGLLETIQNAMVLNKLPDVVAVPIFDPDKSNDGAVAWCENFNKLGGELKWSSFEKVAKTEQKSGTQEDLKTHEFNTRKEIDVILKEEEINRIQRLGKRDTDVGKIRPILLATTTLQKEDSDSQK